MSDIREGLEKAYNELAIKDFPDVERIMTTGLAGGLYCPYKGLLPATSQDVLNYSPTAHPFLQA